MTTSFRNLAVALLLATMTAGCQPPANQPAAGHANGAGSQAGAVDQEACTHLANGPAITVSAATAPGSGAPLLAQSHARYDVTLTFLEGKHTGFARYQSGKAGDYVIYVNKDVPVSVQSAEGPAVAPEAGASGSAACGEIKGRHVVPLGIGTYYIKLGPTAEQNVGVLIEAAGDEHGHEH